MFWSPGLASILQFFPTQVWVILMFGDAVVGAWKAPSRWVHSRCPTLKYPRILLGVLLYSVDHRDVGSGSEYVSRLPTKGYLCHPTSLLRMAGPFLLQ